MDNGPEDQADCHEVQPIEEAGEIVWNVIVTGDWHQQQGGQAEPCGHRRAGDQPVALAGNRPSTQTLLDQSASCCR
jgi:hypothetical protein